MDLWTLEYWEHTDGNGRTRGTSFRVTLAICTSSARAEEIKQEHRKKHRNNLFYNITRVTADQLTNNE